MTSPKSIQKQLQARFKQLCDLSGQKYDPSWLQGRLEALEAHAREVGAERQEELAACGYGKKPVLQDLRAQCDPDAWYEREFQQAAGLPLDNEGPLY